MGNIILKVYEGMGRKNIDFSMFWYMPSETRYLKTEELIF